MPMRSIALIALLAFGSQRLEAAQAVVAAACAAMEKGAKSITTRDGSVVIFVQTDPSRTDSSGTGDSPHQDLCIQRNGLAPSLLVAGRGPLKEDDMRKVLTGFDSFLLSADESTLYFTSDAWATAPAAHAVNLRTRVQRFLSDGSVVQTIERGSFRGKLLIGRSRLDSAHPANSPLYTGRTIEWAIIDPASRKTLARLPSDEQARRLWLDNH